jgi:alpha-tubulin suppressor-like RCC1 family protein
MSASTCRRSAGLGAVIAVCLAACATKNGSDGASAGFDAGDIDATFGQDEGTDAPAVDSAAAEAAIDSAAPEMDSSAPEAAAVEAGAMDSSVAEAATQDASGEATAPEAGVDGSATDSGTIAAEAGLPDAGIDAGAVGFGKAVSVSVGTEDACALTATGGVVCWGSNQFGQLGNGSSMTTPGYSDVPVQVTGITSGATALSVGDYFACAVVGGAAMCWGENSLDMLGIPSTTMSSGIPVQVTGLASGVTAIAAGVYVGCAIVSGGVMCWGSNDGQQLGSATAPPITATPLQVTGLTSGVTALAVGYTSACVIVSGSVMCWGNNNNGQLGNNARGITSLTPVQVTGLTSGATAVSVGNTSTCAVVSGNVWCWGFNGYGELGIPPATNVSAVPVQVAGLTNVTAVSFGAFGDSVCATTATGDMTCWGEGTSGQLGNMGAASSPSPVQVSGLTTGASSPAAGFDDACAVVACGVQCWGIGVTGELGNGTSSQSLVPSPVNLLGSAVCP